MMRVGGGRVRAGDRPRANAGRAAHRVERGAAFTVTCLLTGALATAWALLPSSRLSAQDAPPEMLILSPEPGGRLPADAVLVAVSFVDRDSPLDAASITLEVDGRDVTAEARVGERLVTWRPSEALEAGPHRVVLNARTGDGAPLPATRWFFTVAPAEAEPAAAAEGPAETAVVGPAALQGSIIVDAAGQSVSGPGSELRRDEDFVPRLWLNAGGSIRPGWRYSASVRASGYEDPVRQPVNRYRFDLRSEHLNLAVGDVNPMFQDLILAGARVRGVQARLRGGPVQLSMVHGRSRRAIDGLLDPTDPTRVARAGTYGRDLIAVRPAIGSGRTFQAGLTLMRVRDDVTSIAATRTEPDPVTGGTQPASPSPKDNFVVGADVHARLFGGRVMVQYQNAISLLANDISGGALTRAQLDSVMDQAGTDPVDLDPSRWERLFILNASLIPLDPGGSTNVAHRLRSTVTLGSQMLSVEWRSIGGAYRTLGYPALQRDREGVRIRDSFTLVGDALAVSAGFERDRDNLDGSKASTTTSTGIVANVAWHPSRDRLSLNASLRLGSRTNGLPAGDVHALDERNRTVSAGAVYPLPLGDGARTELTLNLSFIDRDDPANPLRGSRNAYLLGGVRRTGPEPRSRLSLLYGLNRSELTGFENAVTNIHRLVASVRRPMAPAWAATLDGSLTLARSPAEAAEFGLDHTRAEAMAGGEWEWAPAWSFSAAAGLASYTDDRFPGRDTKEILARLRMSRAF